MNCRWARALILPTKRRRFPSRTTTRGAGGRLRCEPFVIRRTRKSPPHGRLSNRRRPRQGRQGRSGKSVSVTCAPPAAAWRRPRVHVATRLCPRRIGTGSAARQQDGVGHGSILPRGRTAQRRVDEGAHRRVRCRPHDSSRDDGARVSHDPDPCRASVPGSLTSG